MADKPQIGTDLSDVGRGSGALVDPQQLLKYQYDTDAYYYDKFKQEGNTDINDRMWLEAAKRGETANLISLLSQRSALNKQLENQPQKTEQIKTKRGEGTHFGDAQYTKEQERRQKLDTTDWMQKLKDYDNYLDYDTYMLALNMPFYDDSDKSRKMRVNDATGYEYGEYTDKEWAEEIMDATVGRYEAQKIEERKANRNVFQTVAEETSIFLSQIGYRFTSGILKGAEGLKKIYEGWSQITGKIFGFKPGLINIINQIVKGENLWTQDLNQELAKIAATDSPMGKIADNLDDISYHLENMYSSQVNAVEAYEMGYRSKNFNDLSEILNYNILSENINVGQNWWGKVYTGSLESMGEMIVPTILTMGAGAGIQAGTTAAKVLGAVKTGLFYTSMTGNNISEVVKTALNNGLEYKDINMGEIIINETIKSAAQLGVEVLLGKLIGFTNVDKFIGLGAGEEAAIKFIGKTEGEAFGRAMLGVFKDAVQEGLEEVLQDTSDAMLNYFYAQSGSSIAEIYEDMNNDFGLETLFISFSAGALTSLVVSSFQLTTTMKNMQGQNILNDKNELQKMGKFQTYNLLQAISLMEEWNETVNNKDAKLEDRIEAGSKLKATINTLGEFFKSVGVEKIMKAEKFLAGYIVNQAEQEQLQKMTNEEYASKLYEDFVEQYDKMMTDALAKERVEAHNKKYSSDNKETKNIFIKLKNLIANKLANVFKKDGVTQINNVVSKHTANTLSDDKSSLALKMLDRLGDGEAIVGYNGLRMRYEDGIYFVPNNWLESGDVKEIVKQRGYELVRETVIKNLNKSQRDFILSIYNKVLKNGSTEIEDAVNALLFDRKFYSLVLMNSETRKDKGAALKLFATIDQIINSKAKTELQAGTLSEDAYKTLMNKVYQTMRTGLVNYFTHYEAIDITTISEYIFDKQLIKEIQQNRNVVFSELLNRLKLATINPDQRAAEYEKILNRLQTNEKAKRTLTPEFCDLLRKQIRGEKDGITDAVAVLEALNNSYNYIGDQQKLVYLPSNKENEQLLVYDNDFTKTVGISIDELIKGENLEKLDRETLQIVETNGLNLDDEIDRKYLASMMLYNISNQNFMIGNNNNIVQVYKAEDIVQKKYLNGETFKKDLQAGKITKLSDVLITISNLPDIKITHNTNMPNSYSDTTKIINLNNQADINTVCHEATHATQDFMQGDDKSGLYVAGADYKPFRLLPDDVRLSLLDYISTHFPAMYEMLTNEVFGTKYGKVEFMSYALHEGELQALAGTTLNMQQLGFKWENDRTILVSPDGKTKWSMQADAQKAYVAKTRVYNSEIAEQEKQSKDIVFTDQTNNQGDKLTEAQVEYFKDSKIKDKNGKLLVVYHGTDAEFDTFQKQKPKNGQAYGDGFYFSTNENRAKGYGDNIIKAYLNITNPTTITNLFDNMTPEQILDTYFPDSWTNYREGGIGYIKGKLTSEYNKLTLLKYIAEHNNKEVSQIVKELGFDGIIVADQIVAYEPNQIKRTDNLNPTSKDEMSKELKFTDDIDNQGNRLTEAQVKFFADSEARNEEGQLEETYHGTDKKFDTFKRTYSGAHGESLGPGYYFTTNKSYGLSFGDNLITTYLNIKNLLDLDKVFDKYTAEELYDRYLANRKVSPDDLRYKGIVSRYEGTKEESINELKQQFTPNKLSPIGYSSIARMLEALGAANNMTLEDVVRDLGFDGLKTKDVYVVYEANQIKRVDNLNPTNLSGMSQELKFEDTAYDRDELVKRVKANVEKQVWNKVADNDPKFANKSPEQIKAMIDKRFAAIDQMTNQELEEKYPKALAKLREDTVKANKEKALKEYEEKEQKKLVGQNTEVKKATDTSDYKVKTVKEKAPKTYVNKNTIYISNKIADQSNMKYFKRKGKPIYIHQGVYNFVVATTDYYDNLSDAKKANDPLWQKIKSGKLNYFDISQYVKSADNMPEKIWKAIAEQVYKNDELAKLSFKEMKDLRDNIEVYATIAMVAEELEKKKLGDKFNRGDAEVNTKKLTYKQIVDLKNRIQEQITTDESLAKLYANKNKVANSTKLQDGRRVEAFADPKQLNTAMLTTYDGTLGSLRFINFKGTQQANNQVELQLIENADSGQIEEGLGGWNWTDKKTLAEIDYTLAKEEMQAIDRVDKENFLEDYYKNTVIKKLSEMTEEQRKKYTPEKVAALLEKRFAELEDMSDDEINKRYLVAMSKTAEGRFETSETSTPYEEQSAGPKNIKENAKQKLNRLASLINNKREYDALPNELKEYIDFKSYRDKNKARLKADIDWKNVNADIGNKAVEARKTLQEERKVAQKAAKTAEQNQKRLEQMSKRVERAEEQARKAKQTIAQKLTKPKRIVVQVPFIENTEITDTADSIINTEWDKTRMSSVQELSNNKEQVVTNAKQFYTENAEAIMNADLNEISNTAKWFMESRPANKEDARKFEALKLYFLGYVFGETGENGLYANMNANLKQEIENELQSVVSTGATAMAVWNNIKSLVNPLKAMESHALVMDGVTIPADLKSELFEAMDSVDIKKIEETQAKVMQYVIEKKIKNKTKSFFQRAVAYRSLSMLSSPVTWLRNKVSNMIIKPLNKIASKIGNAMFKGHTMQGQLKLDTNFSVSFDKNGKPIFKGNITPEIQQYIVKNFIDSGLFDKFVKNLSKYNPSDIKEQYKTNKGVAKKEAILAQLVLKSMYNQYYNSSIFNSKFGNMMYSFIMDRLSDEKYVREAAIRYFGKILSERNYNLLDEKGEVLDKITDETMSDFASSLGLALKDYMHSDNFFNKFENAIKDNTAGWAAYKAMLPFAAASWNWFKGAMNLSPLGLARAIVRFTRLEQSIRKAEDLWSKGKNQINPELTEYIIRRDLGQGIIGTIGWGLGILLAGLGFIRLKKDDYDIPKLQIGNLTIDISSIFGSNSILAGAAMVEGLKEGDFIEGLNKAGKVMLDNMPLMELLELDMYSSGPADMVIDYLQQSLLSFIPNGISWIAGAGYSGNLQKNTFLKRAVAKIPFLNTILAATGVLDKKVDIYTGSTGSYLDALNRIIPYFSLQIASDNENKTTALGLNKTMLRGQYTINGQSFVVTGSNLQKLNERYGQWNAEDLTKFYDNKMRIKVKVGNTHKTLSYNQMTDEQRKSAVQTIMSNNAELTKIVAWLSKGHKYYASEDTYNKLISKGIRKNVYKGTKGFVE